MRFGPWMLEHRNPFLCTAEPDDDSGAGGTDDKSGNTQDDIVAFMKATNDTLGALVANLIEADMFICLTDVVGLYNGNPHTDPDARPIYTVAEITPEIEAMAGKAPPGYSSGGMVTRLVGAKIALAAGCRSAETEEVVGEADDEELGDFPLGVQVGA